MHHVWYRFQLVLTDKLRSALAQADEHGQPTVQAAAVDRMAKMVGYTKSAEADNVATFHGREVRNVQDAAGGMGFVLQLCHTEEDPEGWTQQEVGGYDGWGHDSQRTWRNGERLEGEGCKDFRRKFGTAAYTLHHRRAPVMPCPAAALSPCRAPRAVRRLRTSNRLHQPTCGLVPAPGSTCTSIGTRGSGSRPRTAARGLPPCAGVSLWGRG